MENVATEKDDNEITVSVQLKILSSVNESYELTVRTNWGTKGNIVNPYDFDEGSTANLKFKFRKRPNSAINKITLFVDEKEAYCKEGILLGQDKVEFTVGNCTFSMIHIVDKNFETADGNNLHNQLIKEFYVGQTTVTQELWKAVMGENDKSICNIGENNWYYKWVVNCKLDSLVGSNKPMIGITYEDCLEFIKRLNNITGKNFRLPTDREWLFAANGTTVEKRDFLKTMDHQDAWFAENSENKLHDVAQKAPNQFGLYDIYGNVWERVLDREIKRGGSFETPDNYGIWPPIQGEDDEERCSNNNTGFRLLLVNDERNNLNEEFVDLGLSVLWARNWIRSFNGTSKVLPTEKMATELLEKCNSEKIGSNTYRITGPNKNYIYVPDFWLMLSGNRDGNKYQALNFMYSQVSTVYLKNVQGLLQIKNK